MKAGGIKLGVKKMNEEESIKRGLDFSLGYGEGKEQERKRILELIKNLPKHYTAQVLTDELATANFVGKEMYDKFKDKEYSFVWIKLEELKKLMEKENE